MLQRFFVKAQAFTALGYMSSALAVARYHITFMRWETTYSR